MLLAFLGGSLNINANPVTVYGIGIDRESAKQDAFRIAIEKICGIEILSDREYYNSSKRYNKIQIYSQCKVVDYQILEEEINPHKLKMSISVQDARNGGIFISSSNTAFPDNLSDIINNYNSEKSNGDNFIVSVLRHYPYHAYNLYIKEYNIFSDDRRELFLEIPYAITWNKNFVKHIDNIFSLIGTRTGRGSMSIDRKIFFIDDVVRLQLVKDQITGKKDMRIRVKALDKYFNTIFSICHSPRYVPKGIFFSAGVYNKLSIYSRDKNNGTIYVKLHKTDNNINIIYVDIVAHEDCKLL